MRSILLSLILILLSSCASPKHNNDMKNEHLTYFSYDHHNSMSQCGEKYIVSLTADGRTHVIIDEGHPTEKEFYLDSTTIFDDLQAIVDTYKMDKYKTDYKPRWEVFDGDSWSLYYKYDSQRSVSSGGYMAWPDNYHEMRKALASYFLQWRNYELGVMVFDYFKFTCKNNRGCDIEYTLTRGDKDATMTLHDAERGIDSTLTVNNDILRELQERANSVQLKSTFYDYRTDDPEATRCTYYVRYNTGDTLSGITCHTQYPSHKVSGIIDFFNHWLKN